MPGARILVVMPLRPLPPAALLAVVSLLALLALGPSASTAAAAAGATAATAAGGSRSDPGWTWPVDGAREVVRPFVAPPTPYAAGHRGVDLAAPAVGADVVAATGGVVHFAGTVVDRGVVTIRSGPLLVAVEPVAPSVAAGDRVAAGDVIGTLEAGHCARPCVHLGVREAGAYVSPLRWLGGLRRAVLLPLEP